MNNHQSEIRRKIPEKLKQAWTENLVGSSDPVIEAAMTLAWWSEMEEARDRHKVFARQADFHRDLWVQASLRAVQSGDIDFFRRVAEAYEQEQREPRHVRVLYFAQQAYIELYKDPDIEPEEITKLDVRRLAKRLWAFHRLKTSGRISGDFMREFKDNRERLVDAEIRHLPEQRWQDIWKRPEFCELKEATRGKKPNSGRVIVD